MKLLRFQDKKKYTKRLDIRKKALKRVRFFTKNPFFKKPSEIKKSKIFARKYTGIFKKSVIVIVCGVILGVCLNVVLKSEYFEVSVIKIEGAVSFVSEEDMKQIAEENLYNKNIFLVNASVLSDILKDNFLGARSIFVKKNLPNEIFIKVLERKPIAVIYNRDAENKYLVDEDGYVLGIVDTEKISFPQIEYNEKILVGSFIDVNIVPLSKEILETSAELNLNISSMSFNPKFASVYINNSINANLSLTKSIKESMNVISSLIKQSSLEGKNIKKIDLRYDKVVVSYE